MHQFQPSLFPCMNARCFNGPSTLVSNKLRHFHGGRNESVFPLMRFFRPFLRVAPRQEKKMNTRPHFHRYGHYHKQEIPSSPTSRSNCRKKSATASISCSPPVKLSLSSHPHGRLNMLNPIKRPFSAPYVSASQSLFAACIKKGGLNGHAIPFKPPCRQDFHNRRNSR